MTRHNLWLGAALLSTAAAFAAPDGPRITPAPKLVRSRLDAGGNEVKAIVPTESGQIGINPVSAELGNPDDYLLTYLGPNNPIVTWNGHVYQVSEQSLSMSSSQSVYKISLVH